MIKIKINNSEFLVKNGISVLEACKYVGISVPRFCYHETLSVAGNCRMCLVEIEKTPKPVSSCTLPVAPGMQIYVDTPLVKKARENVVEALLLNHPLDCPICDQGGECDLQDQTKSWGRDHSRFFFNKRGVEDKECGPLIKTIMTRCIHCTRCVRFGSEVAGVDFLGTLNRGTSTEIGSYVSKIFSSEISGNVIDLCPVGALTSKPYAFKARPWELKSNESVDLTDSTGSSIYVNFKETEIVRVLPKNNSEINESIISDKARFSYDSNSTQRLQKLFKKDGKSFNRSSWSDIFSYLDNVENNNSANNVTFLVNNDIDLESAAILNFIENKFKGKVRVRLINKEGNRYENSIVSWSTDKILDINKSEGVCFLLSSNIRIESAVINTRLRRKVTTEKFDVVSSGLNFQANFPSKFVNLNIENLLKIVEGKSSVSNLLLKLKSPVIVLGDSLKNRFAGNFSVIEKLKQISPSSVVLDIKKASNSYGCSFMGLKQLNQSDINNCHSVVAVNLNDSLQLRRVLKKFKKPLIWLNSYGSEIATTFDILMPSLNSFESESTYINLEGRAQKTLTSLSGFGDARDLKKILISFYSDIDVTMSSENFKYLGFLKELTQNPDLFKNVERKFSSNDLFSMGNSQEVSLVSKHPLKATIEDFYLANSFTKNSPTMAKCSQEYKKKFTNFK
jgi:NADH-quinone oxidoreductase chain G